MIFGTNIHVPLRTNHSDFGDLLTFYAAPPASWNLWLLGKPSTRQTGTVQVFNNQMKVQKLIESLKQARVKTWKSQQANKSKVQKKKKKTGRGSKQAGNNFQILGFRKQKQEATLKLLRSDWKWVEMYRLNTAGQVREGVWGRLLDR